MDETGAPQGRQDRVPGVVAGRITLADDFDEFTAEDEALWYGDDDLLVVDNPFADVE